MICGRPFMDEMCIFCLVSTIDECIELVEEDLVRMAFGC